MKIIVTEKSGERKISRQMTVEVVRGGPDIERDYRLAEALSIKIYSAPRVYRVDSMYDSCIGGGPNGGPTETAARIVKIWKGAVPTRGSRPCVLVIVEPL